MMNFDHIWYNARIWGHDDADALAVSNQKISWIGRAKDLAHPIHDKWTDLKNKWILPGFIDCHTHVIFGGNRANEFFLRQQGATYQEISAAGGGILSTVKHTRALSQDELLPVSLPRIQALHQSGVTTMEIKSGYGLRLQDEINMLKAAQEVEQHLPISVLTTFLGAHTVPPEYSGKSQDYVDYVCKEMIPAITEQTRVHALDVFCEHIAFSLQQTEQLFVTASQHGLKIKCHAEQLSRTGACQLSAKYHALSVDHIEYAEEEDIKAIKQANTVAVLLPGAFYFLQEKKLPPIAALRQHHVPIAIATDCNPGTSPLCSMLIALNLAVVLFKLTLEEAIDAVTKHAAQALGIQHRVGSIDVGKHADFCVWNVTHPEELMYYLGLNSLEVIVKKGVL